jgi:hypothetical protein
MSRWLHAQQIYFDKQYDSGLTEYQSEGIWGRNSILAIENSYMVLSMTLNNQSLAAGFYLMRVDLSGEIEWSVTHLDENTNEFCFDIIPTADNGFAINSSPFIITRCAIGRSEHF